MQNQPTPFSPPADIPGNATGRMAFLRQWVKRHPYLGALLLLAYWLVLLLVLGRLLALALVRVQAHISFLAANLLGELLLVLIVVCALSLLGWWSEAGFTRGITASGIRVCLFPLLLIAGPALLGSLVVINQAPLSIIAQAALLALLVGFAEEGMFRGLILRALLPRGIWSAVLLSALCFACVHLTNVFHSVSWGYVLEQMILAFGSGVLFAAVRLRTSSIWPCLFLHAMRDVTGLIVLGVNPSILNAPLTSAGLVVNVLFCLFFILNALVLLRTSQLRKLKIAYGLAPAPAITPPDTFLPTRSYAPPSPPYPDYTSPEAYREPPTPGMPPYMPFDGKYES